jgi:predicted Zn-dependent peptidase
MFALQETQMLAPQLYGTIRFGQGTGGIVILKLISSKFDKFASERFYLERLNCSKTGFVAKSSPRNVCGWALSALKRVFQQCALIYMLCAFSVIAESPIVSEFVLENGVRVLYAQRPGCGAIHAAWFIEGGRSGTGAYPPVSADILLAAWFADFDMLGASGFWMKASAGGISHGRDITPEALEDWCRAELNRFRQALKQEQIDVARRALQSQRREQDPMTVLRALVSAGNTVEVSEQKNTMDSASISTNGIQALADKYLAASRFLIVLIGDVEESLATGLLNNYFGGLKTSDTLSPKVVSAAQKNDSKPLPLEERKKEIPSEDKTEVLVAWPIPPRFQGSWPHLELYAEILAGGAHSALIKRLVTERGCSYNAQALVGLHDGYAENLFVIRADVADGHTAREVESAIQNEAQNLLRDRLVYDEINRVVNRLNAKQALRLANASGLAQALIYAYESVGDWSQALHQVSDNNLEPINTMFVWRSIFQPDSSYSVLAERDPIRFPKNREQARLVSLLLRLSENKLIDQTQREIIIKNTIRQYELTPGETRGQLFSMFEAEAAR